MFKLYGNGNKILMQSISAVYKKTKMIPIGFCSKFVGLYRI